jgi:hypothetical protein
MAWAWAQRAQQQVPNNYAEVPEAMPRLTGSRVPHLEWVHVQDVCHTYQQCTMSSLPIAGPNASLSGTHTTQQSLKN